MNSSLIRQPNLQTALLPVFLLLAACNSDNPGPVFDGGLDQGVDATRRDGMPADQNNGTDARIEPSLACPFPYTVPQTRELPGNDAGISSGPTSATDIHVRCQIDYEGVKAEVLVKAIPVGLNSFSVNYEAREAYLCQEGQVQPLTEFTYDRGGNHGWDQLEVTFGGKRYSFNYSEVCVGSRPCTPFVDQYDVFDAVNNTKLAAALPTICAGVSPGGMPQPLVPQARIKTNSEASQSVPFSMGSNNGDTDEQPVHEVVFFPVRMDQREATNEEVALFLNDHGNDCDGHDCVKTDGPGFKIKKDGARWQAEEGFAQHPAVQVTWYGASAYCAWRQMLLPNELTWEAAASALGQRLYPWGDTAPTCDLAPHEKCAKSAPDLPCSHAQGNSQEGICDLSGNLAEWISDWYQSDFYQLCSTSQDYGCGQGPDEDTGVKGVRGGSFAQPAHHLRAADRYSADPTSGASDIGVRCISGNPS